MIQAHYFEPISKQWHGTTWHPWKRTQKCVIKYHDYGHYEKGFYLVKYSSMGTTVNSDRCIETETECLPLSSSSHKENVKTVATPWQYQHSLVCTPLYSVGTPALCPDFVVRFSILKVILTRPPLLNYKADKLQNRLKGSYRNKLAARH
jgi:hypothetical protein